MAGGISIGNDISAPIYFSIAGTTVGQFAANGFHLPSAPLEISSGGTGTATAPTVGQALVATSTTAYAPTTLASANLSDVQYNVTFNPGCDFTTSSSGFTYTSSGVYSRVGRIVWYQFYLKALTLGSAAGNLECGLPIPAVTPANGLISGPPMGGVFPVSATTTMWMPYVASTGTISFYTMHNDGSGLGVMQPGNLAANNYFWGTIVYSGN